VHKVAQKKYVTLKFEACNLYTCCRGFDISTSGQHVCRPKKNSYNIH